MEQKQQQGSRYGSRWKKWLLVYIAIAAIAYFVIYLVFFHHGGGGGGGGGGGYLILPLLLEAGRHRPGRAMRRTEGRAGSRPETV
jgi:hypothetical protein